MSQYPTPLSSLTASSGPTSEPSDAPRTSAVPTPSTTFDDVYSTTEEPQITERSSMTSWGGDGGHTTTNPPDIPDTSSTIIWLEESSAIASPGSYSTSHSESTSPATVRTLGLLVDTRVSSYFPPPDPSSLSETNGAEASPTGGDKSQDAPTAPSSGGQSISTGGIVGIVLGVLGIGVAMVLAILLWRRKKRWWARRGCISSNVESAPEHKGFGHNSGDGHSSAGTAGISEQLCSPWSEAVKQWESDREDTASGHIHTSSDLPSLQTANDSASAMMSGPSTPSRSLPPTPLPTEGVHTDPFATPTANPSTPIYPCAPVRRNLPPIPHQPSANALQPAPHMVVEQRRQTMMTFMTVTTLPLYEPQRASSSGQSERTSSTRTTMMTMSPAPPAYGRAL